MGVEVRVHQRIGEIDPVLWDEPLDPDDLQAAHRFITACEESTPEIAYRHLLISDGPRVVGTASLFRMIVELELLAGPAVRRVVRAARRLMPRLCRLPVIFCGLPVSFGGSCLRVAPGATAAQDAGAVATAVATELRAFARDTATGLACVKELDAGEEQRFGGALAEAGFFVVPSIPFCALRLRWPSPDAYVDAMRASYRRQLRASSRALARAGARIRRVDDYQSQIPELYRLYREVMDRAPLQLEQLTLAFFGALKRRFGATSHALLVERDGAILASALVLESPSAHTFLIAGIDYAHHRQTHAYLALVAELIARAIASGKKLIALGQTSYDLKRRLGADTSPRQIFLRHEQPLAHGLLRLSSGLLFPRRSYPALPVFKGPPLAPS